MRCQSLMAGRQVRFRGLSSLERRAARETAFPVQALPIISSPAELGAMDGHELLEGR